MSHPSSFASKIFVSIGPEDDFLDGSFLVMLELEGYGSGLSPSLSKNPEGNFRSLYLFRVLLNTELRRSSVFLRLKARLASHQGCNGLRSRIGAAGFALDLKDLLD